MSTDICATDLTPSGSQPSCDPPPQKCGRSQYGCDLPIRNTAGVSSFPCEALEIDLVDGYVRVFSQISTRDNDSQVMYVKTTAGLRSTYRMVPRFSLEHGRTLSINII
jgi:hypothetical protein